MGMSGAPVAALAVIAGLFLLAPILIVVPMSFSTAISFEFPPPGYGLVYYRKFAADADWLEPTMNSFIVALGTTVLTLLIVLPAAFVSVPDVAV